GLLPGAAQAAREAAARAPLRGQARAPGALPRVHAPDALVRVDPGQDAAALDRRPEVLHRHARVLLQRLTGRLPGPPPPDLRTPIPISSRAPWLIAAIPTTTSPG